MAEADALPCGLSDVSTIEDRKTCLSTLSRNYQKAEARGDLEGARRVIEEDILPFLNHDSASDIRTESLMMNLSRIRQSIESRLKEQNKASD